jgi:hypothetical protein
MFMWSIFQTDMLKDKHSTRYLMHINVGGVRASDGVVDKINLFTMFIRTRGWGGRRVQA